MLATQSKNYHTFQLDDDPLFYVEILLVLLATKIYATNAGDLDQFAGLT